MCGITGFVVAGGVLSAGDVWTVLFYDMANDVAEKRGAQVRLVFDSLLPKGYSIESFTGREANELDQARIAELTQFVEDSLEVTGVPGASLGIIQNGKIVFADGFGVRELGRPERPDGDTLFMIASNTKGLATLLLAKLVDADQLTWQTPVTEALPTFSVGDAETTRRTLVEHLVCACTGMPRQDMEWLFEFGEITPDDAMAILATMQPTSDLGDLFQYSNMLAGAGGFVGGYVMHPTLELGAAFELLRVTRRPTCARIAALTLR